jgi:hypothetical protein
MSLSNQLTKQLSILAIGLAVFASPAFAVGGAPGSPDWPCPQRKVVSLSASDLQWEGELGEAAKSWRQDSEIAKLVETLASRRTTLEDATAALKAYSGKVPAADRTAKLTLVFGGLLDTVNTYRASVISGIERFNRRQKGRSAEIEQEGVQLSEMKKKAGNDPKALAEYEKAVELYDWNVRVFEERRQNLPIACEIPPAIDGRTFELAREIRALMKPGG